MNFNLTLFGQTIAMIVFVWFCMKYIWPFIMEAIETRQKEIADGLAAGERGRSDLVQAQGESERTIAEARDQARLIVEQANARASEIVEHARAEGEYEKARQLEGARSEIEVEINRARDELRSEVVAIAVAGAEKLLAREIDAAAHGELLDQLAAEL
ncbi:F0F1 ATP synthase subunit B [Candidatus Rariloculus sp.]|uniref:F0F1 ATP synthase subunit B n=1 Tax=Candidatus Rariloculus sp. TaxID=3101265 RepID=UPI003D13E889